MMRPDDGQGARKEKSYRFAGGAIEMKPSISGRRISNCMPIHAPNEKPAIQQPRASGLIDWAQSSADAAEIEAQHREIPVREDVVELIDDRMVHGAAELRMRMQHDRDRCVLGTG